jgi:ABC-type bacteriocin/lantibiotic exporter with double-glycine peptidase domain
MEVLNRCIKKDESDVAEFDSDIRDLSISRSSIAVTCVVTLALSYLYLLALRHISGVVVWISYIAIIIIEASFAIFFFYIYAAPKNDVKEDDRTFSLILGVVLSLSTLISIVLLVCFRERIKLVARLFQEAGKALVYIPHLFAQPLMVVTYTAIITLLHLCFFRLYLQPSSRSFHLHFSGLSLKRPEVLKPIQLSAMTLSLKIALWLM